MLRATKLTTRITAGLLLSLAATGPSFAAPATGAGLPTLLLAQAEIDFGDDSSVWANDGECDDPRFTGEGAAAQLVDADLLKDATDCSAAFEAGTITLIEDTGAAVGKTGDAKTDAETTTAPATEAEVDFGDDTGAWANDGECDDPRFAGTGMAAELVEEDIGKDATDCRTLFEAGSITLADDTAPAADEGSATTDAATIDFGDDTSEWANDGECDDPRFTGPGAAAELVDADLMKDATDCQAAFEAGTVTLADTSEAPPVAPGAEAIDFGDDSSSWANDGECDDPRFAGVGMAASPIEADRMKDATDCRTLFEAGSITLAGDDAPVTAADIDFGDDSSEWANDGECDDPRFTGPGAASELVAADLMKDATDCRAAFEAGTVTLSGEGPTATTGFDFGFDSSRWANDGECDDLRFTGPGTDKKLLPEDEMADATDCRTLLEAGEVEIRKVYDPSYAAGAPYDSAGIEFGNNTSSYANDGECDDPRFEGPGTATTLLETDEFRDADDCKAAFEAGTVVMVEE